MMSEMRSEIWGEAETPTYGNGAERIEVDPDKLADFSETRLSEADYTNRDYVEADRVAEPYLTTYKERLDRCPKADRFEDPDLRGESMARPDLSTEKGQKAAEKLAEHGLEGIMYRDAQPDFGPVSECIVQIGGMTSFRLGNFYQADIQCAQKWNAEKRDGRSDWTREKVKDWRESNGYSWHECADMMTMNLVSQDIHGYFSHSGGVAECKRREGVSGSGGLDE